MTTLAIAVLLAVGLLGADTVINSGSIAIEAAIAPKVEGISIDETTLENEYEDQFDAISSTQSLLRPSGDELRRRIDRLGLTYVEAARRLGLTEDGLYKQMRGSRRVGRQTEIILGVLEAEHKRQGGRRSAPAA